MKLRYTRVLYEPEYILRHAVRAALLVLNVTVASYPAEIDPSTLRVLQLTEDARHGCAHDRDDCYNVGRHAFAGLLRFW